MGKFVTDVRRLEYHPRKAVTRWEALSRPHPILECLRNPTHPTTTRKRPNRGVATSFTAKTTTSTTNTIRTTNTARQAHRTKQTTRTTTRRASIPISTKRRRAGVRNPPQHPSGWKLWRSDDWRPTLENEEEWTVWMTLLTGWETTCPVWAMTGNWASLKRYRWRNSTLRRCMNYWGIDDNGCHIWLSVLL